MFSVSKLLAQPARQSSETSRWSVGFFIVSEVSLGVFLGGLNFFFKICFSVCFIYLLFCSFLFYSLFN